MKLALRVLGLLVASAATAGAAVTVRVVPREVVAGSPFALAVTIEDADSLAALRLAVGYRPDREVAAAPPAAHGAAAERRVRAYPPPAYPDSSGSLALVWISSVPVSGGDTLLTLSFEGRGAPGARDTVSLAVIEALAIGGAPVAAQAQAGIVTYVAATGVGSDEPPGELALRVLAGPGGPLPAVELVLPAAARARVEVLDIAGRRAALLWNGPAEAGVLRLPVSSPAGRALPTGIYFVLARVEGTRLVRRFLVIR
jgi:hypothetical protein